MFACCSGPPPATAGQICQWGVPINTFYAHKLANKKCGAEVNDVLYFSKPITGRHKILTPNNVSLYVVIHVELSKGPMVFKCPMNKSPNGPDIFGSIVNPFQAPLDDLGGKSSLDRGQGGKILMVPPGYDPKKDKPLPQGYLTLMSDHNNLAIAIRVTPESLSAQDLQKAVDEIKTMEVYSLAEAGKPPATKHVDAWSQDYDPRLPFNGNFWHNLKSYADEESDHRKNTRDQVYIEGMKKMGVAKDVPFVADKVHIASATALEKVLIEKMTKNVGFNYYGESVRKCWRFPVTKSEVESKLTFTEADTGRYMIEERALTYSIYCWGPKNLGEQTFYLYAATTDKDEPLMLNKTYSLLVPGDVPCDKFWSVTVYGMHNGRSFLDQEKVGISSMMTDLEKESKGGVKIYMGSRMPQGVAEANYIPTDNVVGQFIVLFRTYGPNREKLAPGGGFMLGDIEEVPM